MYGYFLCLTSSLTCHVIRQVLTQENVQNMYIKAYMIICKMGGEYMNTGASRIRNNTVHD